MENIYFVFDKKAQVVVGPLVTARNPTPLVRDITEAVNKPGLVGNSPEDFSICQADGLTFDPDTGNFILAIDDTKISPDKFQIIVNPILITEAKALHRGPG